VALPLLQAFGYAPGAQNAPQALGALAAVYALLPCVLKALAAWALAATPLFQVPATALPSRKVTA